MNHFSAITFVFSPGVALGLLATGIIAVVCEFLRPGLVIPGVAGSLLVVFALHSLWLAPPALSAALWVSLPLAAILTFLLRMAWREHRRKRRAIF